MKQKKSVSWIGRFPRIMNKLSIAENEVNYDLKQLL